MPNNVRTKFEAWLKVHPYHVQGASALFLGALGSGLGNWIGFWLQDPWTRILSMVILGCLGLVIGYVLTEFMLASLSLILIIVFPSRTQYPAIASLGGAIGACVDGLRHGFSVESAIICFFGYGILLLIFCECAGGLWTHLRPKAQDPLQNKQPG